MRRITWKVVKGILDRIAFASPEARYGNFLQYPLPTNFNLSLYALIIEVSGFCARSLLIKGACVFVLQRQTNKGLKYCYNLI